MKKLILKKWLSATVAVSLMFSCVGIAVQAESTDGNNDEVITETAAQSMELLEALGIELPEFESASEVVTRGEFVFVMMQGLGCKAQDANADLPFTDVSRGDYFAGALKFALDMGIVSEGDLFYPYRGVSANEACKMMVVALRRTYQANLRGGYPFGFSVVADACELNAEIQATGDDTVSRNDFYVMITNFLGAQIYETSGIVDGNEIMTDSRTVMERYFDVYETEGVVNADAFTSLYDTTACEGDGFVQVGGISYKCSLQLKLGYSAKIYVKNSSGTKDEILYAAYDNNKAIKTESSNLTYVNASRFEYEDENGSLKGLSLVGSPAYIYNGKADPKFLSSQLSALDATVEFIDNDSDGRYDVVKIWKAAHMLVDFVNVADEYISGKNSPVLELGDSSEKRYLITVDGADASLSDIKSGTIASYYVSRDGLLINIAISSASVFGTIEEYDASGRIVVIDGKRYKYSESFEKNYKNQAAIGAKGSLLLSDMAIGEAFVTESSSEMEYGYFINIKKEPGLSGKVKMKLCTTHSGVVTFDVCDKIVLNASANQSSDVLLSILSSEQMIRYCVDKEDKISKIDTQDKTGYLSGDESDLDNLTLYKLPADAPTSVYFLKSTSLVFPFFEIADDAVMFRICTNTSLTEEQRYRAYNAKSYLSNVASGLNSPMVYNVAEGNVAGAVVVKTEYIGKNLNEYSTGGVIHSITDALTDDGARGLKVVIVSGQNYETYYIDNVGLLKTIDASASFDNPFIAPGDAVRITVGDNETLERIALDFDYSESKITCTTAQGHNDLCKYYFGKIYDRVGDKLMVVPKEVTDAKPEIDGNTHRYVWRVSGNIPIFDTKTNEIYHSTADEVRTYLSSGDGCSNLLVRTSNGAVTYMVVYR